MSERRPWEDWSRDQWLAYRNHIAAWLDTHDDRPNTVMRRCLRMADHYLARFEEAA